MKANIQDIVAAVDFQSDLSDSYLCVETGEVCTYADDELRDAEEETDLSDSPDWYREAVSKAKEFLQNEDSYIALPSKSDFNEYRIMERFISSVAISEQAEILYNAIKGKGAFRRFRDTLERFVLLEQWYEYKEERLVEFVKDWCEDQEICYE